MRDWSASCRLVALALALAPWEAGADANGLRVGEGRLHPYLEVESRYDTLVGYVGKTDASNGSGTLHPYGDVGMHYRPGFDLEVPSESVALRLSAHVDLVWYLGTEHEGTTHQSRVGFEADASATFNPHGRITFKVEDTFRRSDQTSMMVLSVGSISDYNLARFRLGIQPGSGALLIEPGYSLVFEHFEPRPGARASDCAKGDPICDSNAVSAFDYLMHTVHLDATWKILPRTSLVLDSSYASRRYIGELKIVDGTARPLEPYGAENLKVLVGLTGLLTNKLSLTLKGGWGDQLQGGGGFKGVIGQTEAGFRASERFELKAGFLRSFEPHPGPTLSYRDNRFYANLRAVFGERLAVTGEVSYDIIAFGDGRTDTLVRIAAGPSYEVTRWLSAGVGFMRTERNSSVIDDALIAYDRLEYYARMRASY